VGNRAFALLDLYKMNLIVLTIFPEMCRPFFEHGIVRRAIEGGKVTVSALDLRNFTSDRHKTTDDRPYGGGYGMVMKPEPLAAAIQMAKTDAPQSRVVLLSPRGRRFTQETAQHFATLPGLIFICGRYEGVDERICQNYVDFELSIGDYVMTGGELAAMVVMDSVIRLIPGTLGGEGSAEKESFSDNLLEHGHYTRPSVFMGEAVPEVLLSGHHEEIENWRLETSLIHTVLKRKDLLQNRRFSDKEIEILKRWRREIDMLIHGKSVCGVDSLPSN
jgi:tRNA (guanine37-N1)-methyltransferase